MPFVRILIALAFVTAAGCGSPQQPAASREAPETTSEQAPEPAESELLTQVCAHYEVGWEGESEMLEEPFKGDPAVECRKYLKGESEEALQQIAVCMDDASEPVEIMQCVGEPDPDADPDE